MKEEKIPYHGASGFKVPSGYFDNLEDHLCDKVFNEEKQLDKIAVPTKAGFKVPEAYFDHLEDVLVEKIAHKQPRLIKINFRKTFYYAAAVAAIFVGLYTTVFTLGNEQSASWDDVELSAIEQYIDDGYIDLSDTEFSNMIIEDGYIVEESDFATMSSEAVFEYLDENVEDPSFILE
ncbi:MAG: hypothetical protein CMP12_03880 [Zunongwangia sp.]|jgi:hypothetical protein|uniref:DUF3379 domain-containing protein n=1 Tax=Zunongwangia profunda TaxID=398743 RepID=A0A3D5J3E2_9FLAO|nr:hypothetical protein [Zunongwangia profunda]MAC65286.1 hypothetical protein [Flavobacteriaceae bacterium]MAO35045.1 hypothetical protein [Zunongwangia sp.]MAG86416.1 hypothetical protein [Flavobacteriaceae bacterium]MAS69285.1 hypothetical protein [Zunongwangia sp.]HAJ81737.1 hypothetical protein [Zunongwangia profunda]|tara:strand:+ start:7976 stop:8506 length:531 start_codon:yes stop_codon:yes gene_type:complete